MTLEARIARLASLTLVLAVLAARPAAGDEPAATGVGLVSEAAPAVNVLPTTPGLLYKMYDAAHFYTYNSESTFAYLFGGRYLTAGIAEFGLTLDLPSGAALEEIDFYFVDDGPATMVFEIYSVPPNGLVGVSLGSVAPVGIDTSAVSTASITGTPLTTIDNAQQLYRVSMSLSSASTLYRIHGLRVGYRLQVSPAPATPTFNDVPGGDPAYQFIEALVASGITAGCGGGNYCPDNPVTRRQMAVFLARGLGLSWP